MKKRTIVYFIFLCISLVVPISARTIRPDPLLSEYAKHIEKPWLHHEANSEQRQPIYIGASPKDLELLGSHSTNPSLLTKMKDFGTQQALAIATSLEKTQVELEAWPFQNDLGDPAWVFARWRTDSEEPWKWLEKKNWRGKSTFNAPAPALPILLHPWKTLDHAQLFTDTLDLESLYDKPVFGDSIWTSADSIQILGAWYPLKDQDEIEKKVSKGKDYIARVLPQPARFNEKPISFILQVKEGTVTWPKEIQWLKDSNTTNLIPNEKFHSIVFPNNYSSDYEKWIELLSGPTSKYNRKNSADPKNDLEKMADDLERYYAKELGLKTKRQKFKYRGYDQSNLTVLITGSLPRSQNHPILFADHYDTAFEEDTFENTGERVSTPGANDNVTATASLLMSGKILSQSQPKHDIWLVHFTGEEFPADDLGARYFVSHLLKEKIDIQGLVLIDMIGYRKKRDPVFQINLGQKEDSKRFAEVALTAATRHAKSLTPQVRGRFDEESYLYNTDGYIFSNLGFPVIYFNEHLNRKNMGNNIHYHQSTDLLKNIDLSYAIPISKTAIATVWDLANRD